MERKHAHFRQNQRVITRMHTEGNEQLHTKAKAIKAKVLEYTSDL
jgi:hypothetical protein